MTRTRSEYRICPIPVTEPRLSFTSSRPADSQREALATTLLAGYHGTIDDEGENIDDALAAIEHYLSVIERPHSVVLRQSETVIALSFVVAVDGIPCIDPVVVAPDRKRQGLGSEVVRLSLASLRRSGATEVGAAITDGNVASERQFTQLGFFRRGSWPPQ